MSHQTKKRRAAFTLIELLVVISIIAILVALLLPAVQQAREAALRTGCKNNLMQVSIALHNYQASFNMLPPGVVNADGPIVNEESGFHMSWLVQLLHFIDQGALYQRIDVDGGAYSADNGDVRATQLPTLLCPSLPNWPQNDEPIMPSSYAGCTGGDDVPIDVDNGGLLFLNSSVAFEEIRDGTSNTLMVGERRLDDSPNGVDLGWMSGTSATLRNTAVSINIVGHESDNTWQQPPQIHNSPPPDLATGGYSSPHTGGCQCALADGSVRFISENIDAELFRDIGNRDDGHAIGEF